MQGREHRRLLRDGQDGLSVREAPHGVGVAVTDGCGSAAGSEVGARLAAAWLAAHGPAIVRAADADASALALAAALVHGLLGFLGAIAAELDRGGAHEGAAGSAPSMFLFSFVCAAITDERALVVAQGDGLAEYNGAVSVLEAGPDNAPDYPGYGLLGLPHAGPRVLFDAPTHELRSLVLATDGAVPLLDADLLGTLRRGALGSPNPSWLEKRLRALSQSGPLVDDAAVVVLGRRAS